MKNTHSRNKWVSTKSDLRSTSRANCGTTLFEVLVVMAVFAAIYLLALPDFRQLIVQRHGSLALQKLANSIYLARSAAAESGNIAVICPTADGKSCGGQWHQGVLVFLDRNNNQQLDAADKLVDHLQYENLPGTLSWRAFRSKPYLQIIPLGFTRYQNGNFTWCDSARNSKNAHQLILNRTGRVRYAKDTDGDGFKEDSRGRPINCSS